MARCTVFVLAMVVAATLTSCEARKPLLVSQVASENPLQTQTYEQIRQGLLAKLAVKRATADDPSRFDPAKIFIYPANTCPCNAQCSKGTKCACHKVSGAICLPYAKWVAMMDIFDQPISSNPKAPAPPDEQKTAPGPTLTIKPTKAPWKPTAPNAKGSRYRIVSSPSKPFGTTSLTQANKRGHWEIKEVDQRPLYRQYGPPSLLCVYTDGAWVLGLEVAYGASPLQRYYTPEADDNGNLDNLDRACVKLGTSPSRVIELGVASGWWLDALQLRTLDEPTQYTLIGGTKGKGCSAKGCKWGSFSYMSAPEPGAYLAAFTLYVDPDTRTLLGLRAHWGRDD